MDKHEDVFLGCITGKQCKEDMHCFDMMHLDILNIEHFFEFPLN